MATGLHRSWSWQLLPMLVRKRIGELQRTVGELSPNYIAHFRSRAFYYLYSVYLFTELVAPSIASVTMDNNLMLPFLIGIIALLSCFPVLYVMPETLNSSDPTTQVKPAELDESTYLRESYSETAVDQPVENGLWWIFRCRNTLLVVPIFFVTTFRATTLSVLLQYTTVRFGWKLSSVRELGVSTEQVPNANCLFIDKCVIV